MKLTDRLGLATCRRRLSPDGPCDVPCLQCRSDGMAAGLEVAFWLEARYGYSEPAEMLRGVCE